MPTATAITLVFNSPFEVEEKDTVFIGTGFQLPEDLEISSAIGDSFSLSGNQAPVSLTLESDVVWILFETDSSSELRGWFLQWSASEFSTFFFQIPRNFGKAGYCAPIYGP